MIKKFIGHVLALLLATALTFAIGTWILMHTLLSAHYIQDAADRTHLYTGLSTALPKIAPQGDDPHAPQLAIDASVFKNQIDQYLPQLLDHFTKDTPSPTFDVAALATAAGQPVPANATNKPITLGNVDAAAVNIGQTVRQASMWAPFLVLVMAVLIVLVMGEHRLPVLARGSLQAGISLALTGGLVWVSQAIILANLSSAALAPAKAVLEPFIAQIFNGAVIQFVISGAVLILVCIGLHVVNHTLHAAAKVAAVIPKKKPPKTPIVPPAAS